MKCQHCGYEGLKGTFRYLYSTTPDAPIAYRECPKCFGWVQIDELEEEERERKKVTAQK